MDCLTFEDGNDVEIFALLWCFAASISSYLPTFVHNISVPTDMLSRNVIIYQSTQRYTQEERISHSNRGGRLKSRDMFVKCACRGTRCPIPEDFTITLIVTAVRRAENVIKPPSTCGQLMLPLDVTPAPSVAVSLAITADIEEPCVRFEISHEVGP